MFCQVSNIYCGHLLYFKSEFGAYFNMISRDIVSMGLIKNFQYIITPIRSIVYVTDDLN